MNSRVALHVSGTVQGVSLRFNTVSKAKELNLTGYVKNEHDGTVTIEAEGEEEDLHDFIQWLKSPGSPGSVMHLQAKWSTWRGDFTDFEIRW